MENIKKITRWIDSNLNETGEKFRDFESSRSLRLVTRVGRGERRKSGDASSRCEISSRLAARDGSKPRATMPPAPRFLLDRSIQLLTSAQP